MKNESEYSKLLKDPRWQRKRLEIMSRDNFRCSVCNDHETELHVHHTYYAKGKKPWEYPNSDLITLCKSCHGARHEKQVESKPKDRAEKYLGVVVPITDVYTFEPDQRFQCADQDTVHHFRFLFLERVEVRNNSENRPDIWHCIHPTRGNRLQLTSYDACMRLLEPGMTNREFLAECRAFKFEVLASIEKGDMLW